MAGEVWGSGNWKVTEGKEDDFIARWNDFLSWTRDNREGFNGASLIRDTADPSHFISFARWKDEESRGGWQQDPGFAERLGACRALCEDFYGSDYTSAVEI